MHVLFRSSLAWLYEQSLYGPETGQGIEDGGGIEAGIIHASLDYGRQLGIMAGQSREGEAADTPSCWTDHRTGAGVCLTTTKTFSSCLELLIWYELLAIVLGSQLVGDKEQRVQELIARMPRLTAGQAFWLLRIVHVFDAPHDFSDVDSDIFDANTFENFGDALRIHHSFSNEAFTKDKFEYALEKVIRMSGQEASLAAKGNRGHDITIGSERISLKTQADKGIREDQIWISKFMELGRGEWSDQPHQLDGLRTIFLEHMRKYDRILTLRALNRGPSWRYELVEIPKALLERAQHGDLKMKLEIRQMPKPGYCRVRDVAGNEIFQLYFDGGSERKLQVKALLKSNCRVHGTLDFTIPPEKDPFE